VARTAAAAAAPTAAPGLHASSPAHAPCRTQGTPAAAVDMQVSARILPHEAFCTFRRGKACIQCPRPRLIVGAR
jgi:hypothetical protein